MNPTISDAELKSLTDAILTRHGIDFSCYEPLSLKRRVLRVLYTYKLESIHNLWVKILHDRSFIYRFMDEISVGLTSMFRDPELWKRLYRLLPEMGRIQKNLTIWHAGCSTGEEVYTMQILLAELDFTEPLTVWATDISNMAMATARKGIYEARKSAEYNSNYKAFNPDGTLENYYRDIGGVLFMNRSLTKNVEYEHHNLISDPCSRTFDIIFCRNVLIYFDNATKQKIIDQFHRCLNPSGILITGFYDIYMPLMDNDKFRALDNETKIFQKQN